MAFHCKSCGGSMVFDIDSQLMRCQYCDSTCEPAEFAVTDRGIAGEVADSGMIHYTCRSCGAELEGTDESLVGFCPYCGGQALVSEPGHTLGVERLIPFRISKQQCAELYGSYVRRVLYLPRELRDPAFLERFCGIYMPYWLYDANFGRAHLEGSRTTVSTPRYEEIAHYDVSATSAPFERGVVFDGSRYLDDATSERCLPFDSTHELDFNPAYLAGFYADRSTVPASAYVADAREQARAEILDAMAERVESECGFSVHDSASKLDAQITGNHSALYPLWFLTWRNEDRVAYALVNGDTGKVVSDLPLEPRTFAIGCAILWAAIFALLEFFVQLTPLTTSMLSVAGTIGMTFGLRCGVLRERARIEHTNDLGWFAGEDADEEGNEAPARGGRRKRKRRRSLSGVWDNVRVVGLFALLLLAFRQSLIFGMVELVGVFAFLILPLVAAVCLIIAWKDTLPLRTQPSGKVPLLCCVALTVIVALNTAIIVWSPVNDGWYYLGDAVCILGLLAVSFGMMRTYNVSCTRPVPRLFDRQEVDA